MTFLKKFAIKKKAQGIQEELSRDVFKIAKDIEASMKHGFSVAKDTKDGDFSKNIEREMNVLRQANIDLLKVAGNLKQLREKPEQ